MRTMQRITSRRATGRSGGLRPRRSLLALLTTALAFVFIVGQANPAGAYTISRITTEIVVTSERLNDLTVHMTQSFTLNSSGRVTFKVDVHNSGSTRKFYRLEASV